MNVALRHAMSLAQFLAWAENQGQPYNGSGVGARDTGFADKGSKQGICIGGDAVL